MSPGMVFLKSEERRTLQFNIISLTFEIRTWSGYDNDIDLGKSAERETDSVRSRSYESNVNILDCSPFGWVEQIMCHLYTYTNYAWLKRIKQ